MNRTQDPAGRERALRPASGWLFVLLVLALTALDLFVFIRIVQADRPDRLWQALVAIGVTVLLARGLLVVNPNQAAVLLLFGRYAGTVKQNGFFWVNPFYKRAMISLRVRNHESAKLKVNDRAGNPIEIAAIIVWRVTDTYQAEFEVDSYVDYVKVQSESAVRHLASAYAYDGEESEVTLRGATDEVSHRLQRELEERLLRAGVDVIEARLSHLAYAPEIAQAMLQRQQASAVVAARTKIVEGAVGMVELALAELARTQVVTLDEERKAAMVSNLLVVLCSEHAASPVINAGTLYP
jgi:regulator of protease activity HflC (stomatin/prohibitin superfamily)